MHRIRGSIAVVSTIADALSDAEQDYLLGQLDPVAAGENEALRETLQHDVSWFALCCSRPTPTLMASDEQERGGLRRFLPGPVAIE